HKVTHQSATTGTNAVGSQRRAKELGVVTHCVVR
ncbi:MAG: hypothetical protein ACI90M_004370, partial [Candidatus Azotimanducaceae bacterium]